MFTVGCARLKPYDEIAAQVAPERLRTIDGQRVYVEEGGRGPALILLHGFAASSYTFRLVTLQLRRHFQVYAVDLNGFGLTERPTSSIDFSPSGQVDHPPFSPCAVRLVRSA